MHTPNVLWPALIGRAGQTDPLAPVRAILCRTLDANFREDTCFDAPSSRPTPPRPTPVRTT
jgi:hypothetical protein